MTEYAKNEQGRHVCELLGGAYDGARDVLMVDRPWEPGKPAVIRKGDVMPYAEFAGKHVVCGLARYEKPPGDLQPSDMFSLPSGSPTIRRTPDGGLDTAFLYHRYRFQDITTDPSGQQLPRFRYLGPETITGRMAQAEVEAMMRADK